MADNNTEIKIRAKKISQLERSNLSLYEHGDKLYLLISYKPENSENGQNFRLSVQDIIDEIKEGITIPGSTIANEILEYLTENTVNSTEFINSLKRYLNNESAWQTAQRLGKTGGAQTEESWYDLIISGTGGGSQEPTGPEEPTVISVSSVSISGSTASLTVGSTRNFTAVISPSNATNKSVTWSSSNNNIATVNSNGTVTAISSGQVTITVTTVDGNKTNNISINIESAIPADNNRYIFSYASEAQSGIFIKDGSNNITGVNANNVKALSYTQEVVGKVPTTNKNGHGFCFINGKTATKYAFTWDDTVDVQGSRVWIIIPTKFYDTDNDAFVDENGTHWGIWEPAFKTSFLERQAGPISISIDSINYVLVCYNQEGANGKCWMGINEEI